MNKSDLKYGNVVELRNKAVYLYNFTGVPLLSFNGEEGKDISQYKKDLTFINNTYPELDIMKVYKDFTFKELLWERKEPIMLSDDEKAILRNINENYVWIARNENGMLFVFTEKPFKLEYYWKCENEDAECYVYFFDHLFKSIKWEDEEPYNIEDLLKGD